MSPEQIAEWIEIGQRLARVCPEKARQVTDQLRLVVEAQEVIAEHDWQLAFRPGRLSKRYIA